MKRKSICLTLIFLFSPWVKAFCQVDTSDFCSKTHAFLSSLNRHGDPCCNWDFEHELLMLFNPSDRSEIVKCCYEGGFGGLMMTDFETPRKRLVELCSQNKCSDSTYFKDTIMFFLYDTAAYAHLRKNIREGGKKEFFTLLRLEDEQDKIYTVFHDNGAAILRSYYTSSIESLQRIDSVTFELTNYWPQKDSFYVRKKYKIDSNDKGYLITQNRWSGNSRNSFPAKLRVYTLKLE